MKVVPRRSRRYRDLRLVTAYLVVAFIAVGLFEAQYEYDPDAEAQQDIEDVPGPVYVTRDVPPCPVILTKAAPPRTPSQSNIHSSDGSRSSSIGPTTTVITTSSH